MMGEKMNGIRVAATVVAIGVLALATGCAIVGTAATATSFIVSTTANAAIGVGRVATTVVGAGFDALTSAPSAPPAAAAAVPAPAPKK
jgi:hypothetical protein